MRFCANTFSKVLRVSCTKTNYMFLYFHERRIYSPECHKAFPNTASKTQNHFALINLNNATRPGSSTFDLPPPKTLSKWFSTRILVAPVPTLNGVSHVIHRLYTQSPSCVYIYIYVCNATIHTHYLYINSAHLFAYGSLFKSYMYIDTILHAWVVQCARTCVPWCQKHTVYRVGEKVIYWASTARRLSATHIAPTARSSIYSYEVRELWVWAVQTTPRRRCRILLL